MLVGTDDQQSSTTVQVKLPAATAKGPAPLSETGGGWGISSDAVRKLERQALSALAQSRELEAMRPSA